MKNLYLVQVDKYGPNISTHFISYQWMYFSTSKLVKENYQVSDVLIEKISKKYVEDMIDEPHYDVIFICLELGI